MITITRNLARQVRSVFRRALHITTRSLSRPVVLDTGPDGLLIRAKGFDGAAEYRAPGDRPGETLILPFEFLADCEGKRDDPVELSAAGDGRVAAHWRDKAVPQIVQYDVPLLPDPAEFPPMPEQMAENSVSLLAAFCAAVETTDPVPTRFTIDHFQLQGGKGRVNATDGCQLLVQGGFQFPWEEDVLVPRSGVFAAQELAACETVRVGKTEKWLTLASGPWTIHLPMNGEGRFPNLDTHIPAAGAVTSRCRFSEADAAFLAATLGKLPNSDECNHPVTLDLNAQVAVRARAGGQAPTELVLSGSSSSGETLRLNTNRVFLTRAIRLGFRELQIVNLKSPVVCRDEHRAYAWMPLDPEAAIGPHKDAIRIESPGGDTPVPVSQPVKKRRTQPVSGTTNTNGQGTSSGEAKSNGQARKAGRRKARPKQTAELFEQAEAVRASLRSALVATGELIRGLRRHRKQSRLVESTLASLRQLQSVK